MNGQLSVCAVALILLVFASTSRAQSEEGPPVSMALAQLLTPLDSKTSAVGDEVLIKTLSDVTVHGRIVIPKGSKLVGHVGGVVNKSKDEPKSVIAIVIDKAVTKRSDIQLQAIIAAIAAPQKSLSGDPTYEMMHSNEPKMVVSGPRGAAGSGSLSASSKASSTAAVATAEMKGRLDEPLMLTEDSQGAFGYEGVSISWHLAIPPPLTVFASKNKNLKIEAGTQMLLRMAQPQLPN